MLRNEMNIRLDYEKTIEMIGVLIDIRFKLLAFVPTLAGIAVALLTGPDSDMETALVVGILGFLVTIGIVTYDLRNSTIHDTAIHRAKWLETLLDMPRLTNYSPNNGLGNHGMNSGGFFNERVGSPKLWRLSLNHDLGLAIVYATALGGWAFLISNSIVTLINGSPIWSLITAVVTGLVLFIVLFLFDRRDRNIYPEDYFKQFIMDEIQKESWSIRNKSREIPKTSNT